MNFELSGDLHPRVIFAQHRNRNTLLVNNPYFCASLHTTHAQSLPQQRVKRLWREASGASISSSLLPPCLPLRLISGRWWLVLWLVLYKREGKGGDLYVCLASGGAEAGNESKDIRLKPGHECSHAKSSSPAKGSQPVQPEADRSE